MPITNTALPFKTGNEVSKIHERLNNAWEKYLDVLDSYTKASAELKSSFSSGFFALTQANQSTSASHSSGWGKRYGADYYDERIKASRRVNIEQRPAGNDVSFSVLQHDFGSGRDNGRNEKGASKDFVQAESDKIGIEATSKTSARAKVMPQTQPSDATVHQKGMAEDEAEEDDDEDQRSDTSKKQRMPSDPIYMFGVLLPPALYKAQSHFVDSVQQTLPTILNIRQDLMALEIEIRQCRKQLSKLDKEAIVA